MVGASTDIVNTGTLPALTIGPYECDTWSITNNYDGTIRVHAEVSHCIYGLGEHKHILCFKFRFLDSGQIVSNQNLLLVTDRNSGTHNQNQIFSLI